MNSNRAANELRWNRAGAGPSFNNRAVKAQTPAGIIGVKVWIYKGEAL